MSELELLKEINLNKVQLESMVNNQREALTDQKVYQQSCRLDTLIVEYMRTLLQNQKKCCTN